MPRKTKRKTVSIYPKELKAWLKFIEDQKPRYASLSHLIRVAITEHIKRETKNPLSELELGKEEK